MKKGSGCKGSIVCLMVTLCVVIALVLLGVILAMTVFKPRHPITNVDSVRLQNMSLDMDIFSMSVNVNLTLEVDVSVNNPNKLGFNYYNSYAQLNYRGQLIGEAPIPNGHILAEEIKGLNSTLTVMADRLVSNSEVTKDVALGLLPLNSLVRIFGQVNVLGFIKFYVASTSSCDFTLNLSNRTIVDNKCQEKTKISG
ncbi:hypothetical protein AAZX31_18G199500 [Glycine max]|uniref:Uncharacterized protein n=2 Tax=Glycine subgen. Soja TaxID=1462606 RepID=I1N3D0_SOYBN|nr:uncharacterized protein LOC100802530 [Glycine max]XP_028212588.1 uncharacterized protein LOC114395088 [Glycine soja]KAG4922301.1 hypothetical protein JHK86_051114 [Glycine max]KAG4937060.1 hypothetical protein JHK85_051979 [Glycine max]KAG5095566.1 hypothetical protein JHK84_051154 [Glycine max]KHN40589.1 hypothetical protein glysoja_001087 [Glycine soja]KRH00531.1 hypothetical protein GLYMA_18G218800v4 [Glycine max]|eukprot:XP_003551627.1 uncharacterized protein LOC100802530 [Glycine max]